MRIIQPTGGGDGARSFALVASAATTALVAVGFDVLAAEPPVHSMTLALVAVVVGVGRWRLPGRLPGLFVLVNLAVVAQPAVHALNKLLHAGADAQTLPHAHGSVADLSVVAVHVLVALLVVAVAASEPMYGFIASTLTRALALVGADPVPATAPALQPRRVADPHVLWWRVFQRCDGRRGPPRGPGLARPAPLLSPS